MSLIHNPSISTNGLIMYYDMNNTLKSWKGAPTTNVLVDTDNLATGNWGFTLFGNWPATGATANAAIAPDGTQTATRLSASGYSRFQRYAVSANQTYTFSMWVKNVNMTGPIGIQLATGLNGTLVAYGSYYTGVSLTADWDRYSYTITIPSSGVNQLEVGLNVNPNSYNSNVFCDVWRPQLELQSFATPFVAGTRSSTQALSDLTNNYTLTPTNVIYNSNGTFSFNNSWFDLNSNNIITGNNPFTVESWYTTTGSSSDEIFGNYGTGSTSATLWISGRYGTYINGSVYFPGAPLGAGTYFLSTTRDTSGNVILYRNGVQVSSGVLAASIPVTYNFRIGADVNGGAEPFTGSIHSVRVYNRVLTAAEIAQNFNAHRGRYGL